MKNPPGTCKLQFPQGPSPSQSVLALAAASRSQSPVRVVALPHTHHPHQRASVSLSQSHSARSLRSLPSLPFFTTPSTTLPFVFPSNSLTGLCLYPELELQSTWPFSDQQSLVCSLSFSSASSAFQLLRAHSSKHLHIHAPTHGPRPVSEIVKAQPTLPPISSLAGSQAFIWPRRRRDTRHRGLGKMNTA